MGMRQAAGEEDKREVQREMKGRRNEGWKDRKTREERKGQRGRDGEEDLFRK